jgi:hypothetical protein
MLIAPPIAAGITANKIKNITNFVLKLFPPNINDPPLYISNLFNGSSSIMRAL